MLPGGQGGGVWPVADVATAAASAAVAISRIMMRLNVPPWSLWELTLNPSQRIYEVGAGRLTPLSGIVSVRSP